MRPILREDGQVNVDAFVAWYMREAEFDASIEPLVERVNRSEGWERFRALRAFYKAVMPRIIAAEADIWAIDPYTLCIQGICTPIEFAIWCDIRAAGAVMYPQLPVGKYFVDFGNPVARVAIECDGRAYHQDKARDDRRDDELRALGWCVHHIEGWQCVQPDAVPDPERDDVPNPRRAGLIVREIAQAHGIARRYAD